MKRALLSAVVMSLMFSQFPALAADRTWITNVRLVSPEKLDRVENGSVLIENDTIIRVERGAKARKPAGAEVIDGKGYFLTPGLIDSHVHLGMVPGMRDDQSAAMENITRDYYQQLPRSYLYYGFTTVIDLAVLDTRVIDNFNKAPLHPQLLHCGPPLVFANGYPMSFAPSPVRFKIFPNFIYDPAQAASIPPEYRPEDHTPAVGAARARNAGAICLKTAFERGFGHDRNLPVMSPALFGQVRAAATQNGLTLVTHANSFEAQSFAVEGNADVLAHGMWNWGRLNAQAELPAEIKALLDQIVAKRTGFQPTMQVLHGLRAYVDPAYLSDPALRKVIPGALLAWFNTPEGKWFKQEAAEGEDDEAAYKGWEIPLRRQRQVVAYLASKDANILLGSDTPSAPTYGNLPGLNGYREIQQMHQAGMSLAQVFKAATINNARAFKLDARVGTIEAGKAANLLLMKISPLDDIAAYDSVVTVWVGGKQVPRGGLAAF